MADQHADATRTKDKCKTKVCNNEYHILYWDVFIENPLTRASGKIQVKLKYKGRSKPILVEDF